MLQMSLAPSQLVRPKNTIHKLQKNLPIACASQGVPAALVPKQVEIALENDPTLRLVRQAVMIDR